jgi:PQQ-like domain
MADTRTRMATAQRLVRLGAWAAGASVLAGCTSSSEVQPAPSSARPAIEAGVPIADASPLPHFTVKLRPPFEPERAVGSTAFLLDAAADVVYVFDFGRGRFLGPAVTATDPLGRVRTLPGYPYPLGLDQPAQDGCMREGTILVAGGVSGGVVVLPTGSMAPRAIALPTVTVRRDPMYGSGTVRNRSTVNEHPLVNLVACLGAARGVAISQEAQYGTSVAYLLDTRAGTVLASRQLPGAVTVSASPDLTGSVIYTGTNDGKVFAVDAATLDAHQLYQAPAPSPSSPTPSRSANALPGATSSVTVLATGDQLVLRLCCSPRAVLLTDHHGGNVRSAPLTLDPYGPMARASAGAWVAEPDAAMVQLVTPEGAIRRSLSVCKGVFAMIERESRLLVSCRFQSSVGYAVLDQVNLSSGSQVRTYGGGDPIAWLG